MPPPAGGVLRRTLHRGETSGDLGARVARAVVGCYVPEDGGRVEVLALRIRGFRGIETADISFDSHTALIGPNGVGKSTVIDALSLVFGRSKLVPMLTEHDFRGSTPLPGTRISIVATLGGFSPDDAQSHQTTWFRPGRGVEKYWDKNKRQALPERTAANEPLCVEIGFCARFDHEDLVVEQIRYFHDDLTVPDPFDEAVTPFPNLLLNEIGFYVLPARRTWEMTVSFASELFRKAVATLGGVPATAVLNVRDALRAPAAPVDADPLILPLITAVNSQLARLLPGEPKLQIKLTGTDSESVLKALVPHYLGQDGHSLPAGRHGGGLLALQTLILLLETGRARKAAGKSFILALEEPELHVPPGLQRQIVSEATAIASQTICTTHAPRVAACYPPGQVHIVRRVAGALTTTRLLSEPALNIPNAARRLLVDERVRLLEALMYPHVLVPEGRIDFEFLRLLVEIAQGSAQGGGASAFETGVGVVPTVDASVVLTVQRLLALRGGVFAVVDGDADGSKYVAGVAGLVPPPERVVQWPDTWTIENVVGWVTEGDPSVLGDVSARLGVPIATVAELVSKLRADTKVGGLKSHYFAYEEVAFALRTAPACAARATDFLQALAAVAAGTDAGPLFMKDNNKSTVATAVFRFVPN